MWEYRTKPTRGAEPSPELQKLFDAIPELGELYYYRWELTEIFDTAPSRRAAARHIAALRARMSESTLDLSAFWETFDCWKDGILAYFDEGKNSGVVEGINNKARVVTKRAYGTKVSRESLDSLDPGPQSCCRRDRPFAPAHSRACGRHPGKIRRVLHLKTEEPTKNRCSSDIQCGRSLPVGRPFAVLTTYPASNPKEVAPPRLFCCRSGGTRKNRVRASLSAGRSVRQLTSLGCAGARRPTRCQVEAHRGNSQQQEHRRERGDRHRAGKAI